MQGKQNKSKGTVRTLWGNQVIVASVFSFVLIVFTSILLYPSLQNVRLFASERAIQVADQSGVFVDAFFDNSISVLTQAAESIALDTKASERVINILLKHNHQFERVGLVQDNGREILVRDRIALTRELDEVERFREPGFYVALAGGDFLSSVPADLEQESKLTLYVPIKIPGISRPSMVLYGDFNRGELLSEIAPIQNQISGALFIVDQNGKVILHGDPEAALESHDLSSLPHITRVIREGKVTTGLESSDRAFLPERSKDLFTVGVPINRQWGVFVEQSRSLAIVVHSAEILFNGTVMLVLGLILVLFLVRTTHSFIGLSITLQKTNKELNQVLDEQDDSAKMLIKRDLELTDANEKLRSLDEAKSTFVSVVAHQLRTPLSAVKWSLRLLLDGEGGDLTLKQEGLSSKAYESNDRMISLVNDMLNVDRIESGKFRYSFRPIFLHEVMDRVIRDVYPIASRRRITLSLEPYPTDLPQVNGDPEKMQAVVQNLLENAMKYTMEEGKVSVSLSVAEGNAKVCIIDTGIGVPQNQQGHLFKRFFRGANAIKVEANGSGLGLFISKSIIESHDGSIWFTSTEGEGTEFCFSLPLLKEESSSVIEKI